MHPESFLPQPLISLRGIGPERAAQLERVGCRTVGDLLFLRPRRHEDRRQMKTIAELQVGEVATVRGHVAELGLKRFQRGRRSVFELILEDGAGRLHCRWWNMPYLQAQFETGQELLVCGKVRSNRPVCIDHPETEPLDRGEENLVHVNRIVPVYPLTEGLSQRWLRNFVWRTLNECEGQIGEPAHGIALPDRPSRRQAIRRLHFPESLEEPELARQRLAIDEFIDLQRALRARRKALEQNAEARRCPGDNSLIKPFLRNLQFTLTAGQTQVLREIRHELGQGLPMRRLLQGDVGSGKTVVAACAALMVLESGFNAVLMAPTEILAEQHFTTFERWFQPLGIEVRLLTGRRKLDGSESEMPFDATQGRSTRRLTIGTHALIEETVSINNLGLVIIDEQHKFGVAQRETLVRKGKYPHLLVMTATPIPRTLGLTLYGDLDVSILRELPAGRRPIKTHVRTPETLPKVWEFVRRELSRGRQAYVVYPRIDQDDDLEIKSVTREWEALRQLLRPYDVGLLHGRMKTEEKSEAMAKFIKRVWHVLVATQVIEVGLDVPNATVMVIENAERFGLSQLHQLRGRIGRGGQESDCILVASAKTAEAQKRLKILERTSDGFQIAEEDLKLRGPGDLIGSDQSGMPPLRFGDLINDGQLVLLARQLVWEARA